MKVEMDLSFILKYLQTFGEKSYEIKIFEYYKMVDGNITGMNDFIEYIKSNASDVSNSKLYEIIENVITELNNKIYIECGFDINNIAFVDYKTVTNSKVIGIFNVD